MSQGTISDTHSLGSFLKKTCLGSKKLTFFQGVSPEVLVKNDQILKSAFINSFMSLGISTYRKSLLGITF